MLLSGRLGATGRLTAVESAAYRLVVDTDRRRDLRDTERLSISVMAPTLGVRGRPETDRRPRRHLQRLGRAVFSEVSRPETAGPQGLGTPTWTVGRHHR